MKPYRIFPMNCPNCGKELPIWNCSSELYMSENYEHVCDYSCSNCKGIIQVITSPEMAVKPVPLLKAKSTANDQIINNNVNNLETSGYENTTNGLQYSESERAEQPVNNQTNTSTMGGIETNFIPIKCPSCGNEQNVQANRETSICRFCNNKYVVSDARRLFLQRNSNIGAGTVQDEAIEKESQSGNENASHDDFVVRKAAPGQLRSDSKTSYGGEGDYSSMEQVYSNRSKYSQNKKAENEQDNIKTKKEKPAKVKKQEVYDDDPRWVVAKLVIGIISILLFMVVSFQSCAAGLGNALTGNGEISGTFGFLCALNFLVAGIVGLCIRKKGLGAHITVCVFYYLIFFLAAAGAGSYSDLKVWGVLGFIFGSVFLFSALRSQKGYIIGAVVAVLMLIICIPTMSSSSKANKKSKAQDNITDFTVTSDVDGTEDKDLSIETAEDTSEDIVIQEEQSAQEEQVESSLPSIAETTLLDNSGVVIKAVEMTEDSIWGPAVKLYIENNSDRNVHIGCDALIVNDYMITDLFSSSVASGKKTYENLNLSSSGLKAAGIDNIGKIEMYFRLYDDDTWEDIYKSECITLETSEYANMDITPNDAGKEILNQDGIRIVAKYVDEDTFWGKSILLYLENNSEKNIHVSVDHMSINGFMVEPLFSTELYSGKKKIDDITLLSSQLEENGITSVDDVELTFRTYDFDYNDIFETPVSFSTH